MKHSFDFDIAAFFRWALSLTNNRYINGVLHRLSYSFQRYYSHKYKNSPNKVIRIDNYCDSIKMLVDRSSYMGGGIYWRGYHHKRELNYLKSNLNENDVFVDIGANQGEFALLAASILKEGRVICFEPQPDMFERLRKNADFNRFDNMTILNLGLGDQKGTLPIYTNVQHDDVNFNGFHEGLYTLYKTDHRDTCVGEVEIDIFDNIDLNLNRLDYLKIDVEGAELFALKGAKVALQRFKPKIIIEFNEETFLSAGYNTKELIQFLEAAGYRSFYAFNGDQYTKEQIMAQGKSVCNLLAINDE